VLHAVVPVVRAGQLSGRRLGYGMGFWMVGDELGRTLGPVLVVSTVTPMGREGRPSLMSRGMAASAPLALSLRHVRVERPRREDPHDLSLATRAVNAAEERWNRAPRIPRKGGTNEDGMRTYLDCVPCFLRQTLEAARMSSDDESLHEKALRRVLREASQIDMSLSPPAMGQRIHRIIRELTGNPDPYRAAKERTNRLGLALYPGIRERVRRATDPLEMAIRMAIAGNVIDYGVDGSFREEIVRQALERAASAPLHGDVEAFRREAAVATSILYLADNAGEIVLDRVLIEALGPRRVTVVVKGGPVLNDALAADAEAAGLVDLIEVIDNGSDAPGTVLEDCSEAMRSRFQDAGMVVAKGQGNYETLSDAPRPVWFVLMAKCSVITRHIGCDPESLVLQRSQ
jgi:uncharacterized protein with ATP-grasp and redox domains